MQHKDSDVGQNGNGDQGAHPRAAARSAESLAMLLKRSSGQLAAVTGGPVLDEPPSQWTRLLFGKVSLLLSVFVAPVVAALTILSLSAAPDAIAGLSVRDLASIEAIVFFSGVMSGLSGFGFSAIGAASLLLLAPTVQVPLFQSLSLGNQLLSARQLREDMPQSRRQLWAGPGPCILGGLGGVPLGIWLLAHVPAARLTMVFGGLLVVYAVYSIAKPAKFKLHGCGGPAWGILMGFLGGALGGFTAFPGAAVVVWTGLRGLPKSVHRAIVQPYIIFSQIYSLVFLAVVHPSYLNSRYWLLFLLTAPAVVPGTLTGLAIYKRMSDLNFKRVSYLLLGLSGLALLAKTCAPLLNIHL